MTLSLFAPSPPNLSLSLSLYSIISAFCDLFLALLRARREFRERERLFVCVCVCGCVCVCVSECLRYEARERERERARESAGLHPASLPRFPPLPLDCAIYCRRVRRRRERLLDATKRDTVRSPAAFLSLSLSSLLFCCPVCRFPSIGQNSRGGARERERRRWNRRECERAREREREREVSDCETEAVAGRV